MAVPAVSPDKPRVLVLGAGFIGSAIIRELAGSGYDVTVLSRSADMLQGSEFAATSIVLGDAAEMGTLSTVLAETDIVVYALGSSSPAESELDPASDVTAVMTPIIRLLELLRLRPQVSLTFLSSGGAVYGNADTPRPNEATQPHPISSYGLLKLTCERYIEMYSSRFGLDTRILRVANAYGPGQSWSGSQGVVAHLMRSAYTGETIPLYGSGECVRDFIYIDDVARVVNSLIARPDIPPLINVGSAEGYSIQHLLEAIERVSGSSIRARHFPARRFDVRRNVLDCSLLDTLVEFERTPLYEGLTRTWKAATDALESEPPQQASRRAPNAR